MRAHSINYSKVGVKMYTNIKKVCICGSGLMGSGISLLFSANGYKTNIYAVEDSEADVRDRIKNTLNFLVEKNVLQEKQIEISMNNVTVTDNLEEAVEGVDMVIECIPEDLKLKQDLMARLDAITDKKVILTTNTSVISITEIAAKTENKERIVGTHFWNPPYLIPLVEVVRTEYTNEEVIDAVMSFMKKVGKKPIYVKKDVPGFVGNRLQHALWREAVSIVENEIADAKTVDIAIKNSFGLRLPVLGPFENADMVGNDLAYAVQDYILPFLEDSKSVSPVLKKMIKEGKLGYKTGQGFYEWTEESMEKKNKEFLSHIINLNK